MDDTLFDNLIKEQRLAVVHFSYNAVMDHRFTFPDDLAHAISAFEDEPRSCCAVFPGHKMDLPGSVGVIFSPKHSHILSVCSVDSGSSNYAGKECSMGYDPEDDAILESLRVPVGMYNEWRIQGANPVGIFVANPLCIWVKKELTVEFGAERITDIGCVPISLQAVKVAFPYFQVFTMTAEGLEPL